jgi:hypothetical protein
MSDAAELRRKSTLLKRIASIAIFGGARPDCVLLHLAERLDHEAASAEEEINPGSLLSRTEANAL